MKTTARSESIRAQIFNTDDLEIQRANLLRLIRLETFARQQKQSGGTHEKHG